MDLGLSGANVAVTGASKGIGKRVATCLAAEGCNVAICGRSVASLEAAVAELKSYGVRIFSAALDVTDSHALGEWINGAAEAFNGLDIFISNVSAQSGDWGRSFAVDIDACVAGMECAIPHLKRSSKGAVVAVTSQAALLMVPSFKAYAAVKAATLSYMGALARELAPLGVRVNCVSPGEVYYPGGFWERMQTEDPELFAGALKKNVMGRFGTPEEVARAVAFLASPAASFISGSHLLVDGAGREFVDF